MQCERAAELLSLSHDATLPTLPKLGLGLHLLYCPYCRRLRRQLDLIDTATAALPPADDLLPDPARLKAKLTDSPPTGETP